MWDLLLKGATVVDPLNRIEGVRDVAIENGQIAEVGVDLPGAVPEWWKTIRVWCCSPVLLIATYTLAKCGVLRLVSRCSPWPA